MIRYDETKHHLWIEADTALEARETYFRAAESFGGLPLRCLIWKESSKILHMISNPQMIIEFITDQSPGGTLGSMIEEAIDKTVQIELVILCEETNRVCFHWMDRLYLWKTTRNLGETEAGAAFRLLGEIANDRFQAESVISLWNSQAEDSSSHVFVAIVDHEYSIEEGLWLTPDSLDRSWKLDPQIRRMLTSEPHWNNFLRRPG